MPQAESVSLPKRLPLVIMPENRAESTSYDSKLVNCFMEKEKDNEIQIYQRPGFLEHSRPPAANATGMGVFNWRGNIYSIFGNKVYKDGVALAGTVNTTNGVYRFSQSLGGTPRLQLGDGVSAYNYDAGAGLVQIVDVDFISPFLKGWAYLDATTYVGLPDAHIQGSDINDTINWNPLNSILAQVEPDQGKALSKQLVYVVMLKEWSSEIFYDAGNAAGSPLGPVQGAKVDFGCAHQDSVQDVNGVLIWMSQGREAGRQVVALNKLKAEVVSFPAIDRLLQNANITTVYSWQLKIGSHRFYVLTLKEANLTFAFDMTERQWYEWTDVDGNYMKIVSSTFTADQKTIVQHESNGRLYLVDMSYADDNGDIIQVDIITPNFDGGVRRKKVMGQFKVIGDQQVGAVLQVRFNDNDFDPLKWTNWRQLDMSMKEPFLADCGTFTRRSTHLRYRGKARMPRIQAAELQMDLGTL